MCLARLRLILAITLNACGASDFLGRSLTYQTMRLIHERYPLTGCVVALPNGVNLIIAVGTN